MKIHACCFNDDEIKQFIISSATQKDSCDYCGLTSEYVEIEELLDFFTEFLDLFIKDNSGITLINLIQDHWNIFSSPNCAEKILSEIIADGNFGFVPQDKVSYVPEIGECLSNWESLKKEVREEKRYFSDLETFNWEKLIARNATIKAGTLLYRARITPEEKKKLEKKEMGCPPKEMASAGRANPLGIPYLYLCKNIETTFYEIRAVYLDRISVGKFETLRDLNIIDFSDKPNLFLAYSESDEPLIDIVRRNLLFDEISADLSKPLRRFDTEIEYVPTQLICEYCKLSGADGIRYKSSLHQGGTNIVLFNTDAVKCKSVLLREIKNVIIEGK